MRVISDSVGSSVRGIEKRLDPDSLSALIVGAVLSPAVVRGLFVGGIGGRRVQDVCV